LQDRGLPETDGGAILGPAVSDVVDGVGVFGVEYLNLLNTVSQAP